MIVSFSQARTEDCVDKGIDCKAHPKQQQSEIVQSHSAVIPRSIRSEREYWTVLGGDSRQQNYRNSPIEQVSYLTDTRH